MWITVVSYTKSDCQIDTYVRQFDNYNDAYLLMKNKIIDYIRMCFERDTQNMDNDQVVCWAYDHPTLVDYFKTGLYVWMAVTVYGGMTVSVHRIGDRR